MIYDDNGDDAVVLTNAERRKCTDDGKRHLWRCPWNTQQSDKWLNSTVLRNTQLTVHVLATERHHAHTTCQLHRNAIGFRRRDLKPRPLAYCRTTLNNPF